jgi:hypothetical protein
MGLRLNDGGGNHVELTAPTLTSDVSLTLPNSVGTAGQFLQVGAGGVTTWATALNLILQTDAVVSEAQVNAAVTVTNPVVLSGTLPYSYAYQWQFKVSGGSSFSNISGATSSTYTIPATIGSDATEAGQIRCVVTVSDSSTPALTITSTSSAATIAPDIIQGHPGLPYAINTSGAWAAVEVNGSTTTRIRGMAVGYNPSGVRSYVITEGGDIYKGSAELGPYNQAVNSNFAPTSAIYNQGFRNLCLTNNTSGHMGIPYQYTFAAHCIADEDIYVGATNTPGQMNSMRASYPGATTKWITNLGFCSNNAVGLIDDNGTERLINMWTANSALAGANNSTFQDLGLTLPSGRKCKQVCGAYAAGSAAVQGIIILDDQGDLWQVGPCANFIGGVSTGTFANPVQFNPSGMVAMEAITSMGGYTSLAEGFFGKGTNGHLYYVTASQTWGKTLDNVADIPAVSAYGGNALVAMQDGTYRWASGQGALYTTAPASASWTTVNAPTGVTPDASKNKRYPYTHAACSWTNNQSGVIAIPT